MDQMHIEFLELDIFVHSAARPLCGRQQPDGPGETPARVPEARDRQGDVEAAGQDRGVHGGQDRGLRARLVR